MNNNELILGPDVFSNSTNPEYLLSLHKWAIEELGYPTIHLAKYPELSQEQSELLTKCQEMQLEFITHIADTYNGTDSSDIYSMRDEVKKYWYDLSISVVPDDFLAATYERLTMYDQFREYVNDLVSEIIGLVNSPENEQKTRMMNEYLNIFKSLYDGCIALTKRPETPHILEDIFNIINMNDIFVQYCTLYNESGFESTRDILIETAREQIIPIDGIMNPFFKYKLFRDDGGNLPKDISPDDSDASNKLFEYHRSELANILSSYSGKREENNPE